MWFCRQCDSVFFNSWLSLKCNELQIVLKLETWSDLTQCQFGSNLKYSCHFASRSKSCRFEIVSKNKQFPPCSKSCIFLILLGSNHLPTINELIFRIRPHLYFCISTMLSHEKLIVYSDWFLMQVKVHIFWEGHKILWPSQNIWTLQV